MNTMAVLERVAAGELTPEEAATELVAAEKRAKEVQRPRWLPKPLWMLLIVFFAVLGIERDA